MKVSVLDAISFIPGNICAEIDQIAPLDTEETKKAEAAVMRIIEGKEKPYDPQATLVDYGVACQSLGFRNGFKLAVRMMAECMMD